MKKLTNVDFLDILKTIGTTLDGLEVVSSCGCTEGEIEGLYDLEQALLTAEDIVKADIKADEEARKAQGNLFEEGGA